MQHFNVKPGDLIRCQETGKLFTITTDGFTFNYASDGKGNIVSDEGVNIRERRELLDRSKPIGYYLSSDGKSVTGWKGNILGTVIDSRHCELTRISFTHDRDSYRSVRVRDVHGSEWYGRGSPGIAITLRPCAEEKTAVIFRAWKCSGDVLALFPYIDEGNGHCASFEHIGQHGGADYAHCLRATRAAKPEEYAALKSELESAPYRYRLRVIQRRGVRS